MSLKRICGVDLGSDTIKICDKNQKKLLCEKNMIAVRNRTDLIGVGQDAFEIYEKAPSDIYAGCPIQNGSLAEGSSQETILIHLMKNFSTFFTHHPNIYITAPTDITEVERRAYYKILSGRLRAKSVMLVEKGVADAAGIGMPLDSPEGQMIVNLGGDRTEISVISEGKTIIQRTLRTGGHTLDEDIMNMVKKQFQLNIGRKTAEALKNQLAYLLNGPALEMRVFGIHTVTGLPRQVAIPALAVSVSIVDTIDAITEVVKTTMERTPPQLLENIRKNGIYLTGGVSLLPNLSIYMQKELEVPVYNVSDPIFTTVRGLVRIMNDSDLRKKAAFTLKDFAGNLI